MLLGDLCVFSDRKRSGLEDRDDYFESFSCGLCEEEVCTNE